MHRSNPVPLSRLTRRHLLGGLALGGASLAAACGGLDEAEAALESDASAARPPAPVMFRRVRVGNKFVIDTHGMPGHDVGQFPNASCPFPIVARNASYELSATPQPRPFAQGLNGWLFGVSVDGVAFDPTGPFWGPGWEFEVMHRNIRVHLGLDQNNAHVQPSGEYHYHGSPTAFSARRRREMAWVGRPVMLLLGWAADGFPIYAPLGHAVAGDARSPVVPLGSNYRLRVGNRPSGAPRGAYDGSFVQDFEFRPGWGHLDDCNGRWGVTPEYPAGTYYYCITEQYPFVPRSWRGAPNATFWHPLPGPDAVPPGLARYGR